MSTMHYTRYTRWNKRHARGRGYLFAHDNQLYRQPKKRDSVIYCFMHSIVVTCIFKSCIFMFYNFMSCILFSCLAFSLREICIFMSCNFMSCIFIPCDFHCPSFSCLALSCRLILMVRHFHVLYFQSIQNL